MMDKQINLYRNVMRVEQRRKKVLLGLVGAALLGLVVAWGFSQRFVRLKMEMIQETASVEASMKSERALVDTLSKEIKNREAAAKNVQGDFAAALTLLSKPTGPTALTQLARVLDGWRGSGARLKKIEISGERLTLVGEATTREAARAALQEISAQVSAAAAWTPVKGSIEASKEGALVGFELVAASEQAAPISSTPTPTPTRIGNQKASAVAAEVSR
jgi:Tfp pilus assembly protein PilN